MKDLKKIGRQNLKEIIGAGPLPTYPCNCFCIIGSDKLWNACNRYCPGGIIPGVEMGNDPQCDYKLPL